VSEHADTTFSPVQCTPTLRATMHSVTDRQTDGRQDDTNSRSYCVAVRSAKNSRLAEGASKESKVKLVVYHQVLVMVSTSLTSCSQSQQLDYTKHGTGLHWSHADVVVS